MFVSPETAEWLIYRNRIRRFIVCCSYTEQEDGIPDVKLFDDYPDNYKNSETYNELYS